MIMSMAGGGIAAGIGANIAWIRLDRQQRLTFIVTFLLCVAGGVTGGLIGYQVGANREIECCAEPGTTPFTYTAFGATIGANVAMYLATAAIAAARIVPGQGGRRSGAAMMRHPRVSSARERGECNFRPFLFRLDANLFRLDANRRV